MPVGLHPQQAPGPQHVSRPQHLSDDQSVVTVRNSQHPHQHQHQHQHQPQRRTRLISESSLPSHVLAMKMNNKGATYIQQHKNYERAIQYLAKALKLTEETTLPRHQGHRSVSSPSEDSMDWTPSANNSENASASTSSSSNCCTCSKCQLEYCMLSERSTSDSNGLRMRRDEPIPSSPNMSPASRVKRSATGRGMTLSSISNHEREEQLNQEGASSSIWPDGYVYDQPIRVSAVAIQDQHGMGVTLSLIVIFNLALAHQLSAADPHAGASNERRRQRLKKSRQLYELCYQLQSEAHPGSSLKFTMCLANNLSELHRVEGNYQKYAVCLQHLLSTMMYMVDCQLPVSNTAEITTTNADGTISTRPNIRRRGASPSTITERERQMEAMLLDGFFRNASKIILHDNTAAAA